MATTANRQQKRKFLLLTGAPKRQDLSWEDDALTVQAPKEPESPETHPSVSIRDAVQWRKLPLQKTYLHSGLTQTHWPKYVHGPHANVTVQCPNSVDVGTSTGLVWSEATNEVNQQVVGSIPGETTQISFVSAANSISTNASFQNTTNRLKSQLAASLFDNITITDLAGLPTAEVVEKRVPLCPTTFNLLVIVLAVSIKRMRIGSLDNHKTLVDLARLTVADETRSAFEISIWLDCEKEDPKRPGQHDLQLRSAVESIARLNVILLHNVGLRTFRNTVHGCSLRKMTEIHFIPEDIELPVRNIGAVLAEDLAEAGTLANSKSPMVQKLHRIYSWRDEHQQVLSAPWMASEEPSDQTLGITKHIQFPLDTQ